MASSSVVASSSLPAKKRKASNASQLSAGNNSSSNNNNNNVVSVSTSTSTTSIVVAGVGGGVNLDSTRQDSHPHPESSPQDGTAASVPGEAITTLTVAAGGSAAIAEANANTENDEPPPGSSHPSSSSTSTAVAANRGGARNHANVEEEEGRRDVPKFEAVDEKEASDHVVAKTGTSTSLNNNDKPQLPPFKKRRGSSHDSSVPSHHSKSLRSSGSRRRPSIEDSSTMIAEEPSIPAVPAAATEALAVSTDRKESDADRSYESSAASSGQRLLLEAMMMTTMSATAATGGGIVIGDPLSSCVLASVEGGKDQAALDVEASSGMRASGVEKQPLSSTTASQAAAASLASNASAATTVAGTAATALAAGAVASSSNRERLESWSAGVGPLPGGRERLESWGAFLPAVHPRDRLESWGGMSDLSLPHGGGGGGGALGAGAVGGSGSAALGSLEDDAKPPAKSVPSRISLHHNANQRDRISSVASLSEVSVTLPMLFDLEALAGVGGAAGPAGIGGGSVGSSGFGVHAGDLQAYVAAAVASVGDQLVELAEAVENAAAGADDVLGLLKPGHDSETSSIASPLIGAASDGARHSHRKAKDASLSSSVSGGGRPRTWSTGSGKLSVDYEAVQAAIDAGHAAAGTLDIASTESSSALASKRSPTRDSSKAKACRATSRRKLPIARRDGTGNPPSNGKNRKRKNANVDAEEAEEIRDRARAAAGYKLPSSKAKSDGYKKAPPLKKRAKRDSPDIAASDSDLAAQTPVVSNRGILFTPDDAAVPPLTLSANNVQSASDSPRIDAPANKKWEMMYKALVDYAKEREEIETNGMSADDKSRWMWDGHVPTNYKTKDGKPLGRWVNNQRSAKGKGTLKDDRADRLVEAGLKWTEQRSTGWTTMLQELKIYIEGQTKLGKKWDGNVPTGYQIKARPGSTFQGEDKNLGRWVNRQRSMFQAGRLQKDRQIELENLGLKWSMIQTVSWDEMFDALIVYVEEQRSKAGGKWDGNVPTGYRTSGEPSRALGRWINRQRSAYAKNRLKDEYKEKLSLLGLKWSHREGNRDVGDPVDDEIDVAQEYEGKNGNSTAV